MKRKILRQIWPLQLYGKIFLSFVGILLLSGFLTSALFRHTMRGSFRESTHRYLHAQVNLLRETLRLKRSTAEKEELLRKIAQDYRGRLWVTRDKRLLFRTFPGQVPVLRGGHLHREGDMYTGFHFEGGVHLYLSFPVKLREGEESRLHFVLDRPGSGEEEPTFLPGLLLVGLLIALLVLPLSRLITGRIRHLESSSLRLAEGDLSHRVEIRGSDELAQLGRSFNAMAEKIEILVRGSRELTANISHELRSPLARIRLAEELIEEGLTKEISPSLRRHLDTIRSEVEELDVLIGRILQLSRIDFQFPERPGETFDPEPLLEELLERMRNGFERKGMRISFIRECDGSLVKGVREDLRIALSSLLENAQKFSPANGEVLLRCEKGYREIRLVLENSSAFSYEGREMEKLFEPFYREKETREEGTGLGLAVARKIGEREFGRIRALWRENRFVIELALPSLPGSWH